MYVKVDAEILYRTPQEILGTGRLISDTIQYSEPET
jgi:hypothetical protein